MRLRSARLAAAEENELPSQQPTITARQTNRRPKRRQTEVLEADQPAASEIPNLASNSPQPTELDKARPLDASNSFAAAMTDLCPAKSLPLNAQSPVFNAEAAAEAARMAEALLSSTTPIEQPRTSTSTAAACFPEQPVSKIEVTEIERPCSGHPVLDQQAAYSSPGCSPGKRAAADETHTGLTTSPEPEPASRDVEAAEIAPSTMPCQSKAAGAACPEEPAQQQGTGGGLSQAKAAQEQTAQVLTTVGSEDSQALRAKGHTQGSPQHRRVTGRASLALQSRRVSRTGSAEAFERGQYHINLIVTPSLPH